MRQGVKTFELRMKSYSENVAYLAEKFSDDRRVEKAFYLGLAQNDPHEIARQ